MNVGAFLDELRTRDIRVSLKGDRLHVDAPEALLTDRLRTDLAARKQDIVAFLQANPLPVPASAHPIRPRPDGEVPPLSVSQQQLWLLDQLDPGKASYNIVGAMRLRGPLDAGAFHRSLRTVVRRHEALRTTFVADDGTPRVVIDPIGVVSFEEVDLSPRPQATRDDEVREAIAQLAKQPFDLTRLPLFRAVLYRLDEHDHILASVTHHIIADAWSQGVFIRELSALYEADGRAGPSPLAELPFQYGDYARWHRDWLDSGVAKAELDYWRDRLTGPLPLLELPTERPRPAVLGDAGLRLSLPIPDVTATALRGLARDEGTTLFMVLLAGFQIFLARYTGQHDVIVGTAVANRPLPELDGLIGCFLNTLAIRTDLSNDPSARQCLHRVREAAVDAMAHQNVPFQRVVDAVRPERSLNRSPLFQTMLVLHQVPDRALRLGGLAVELFPVEATPSRLDLTVDIRDTGTGLVCDFRGNLDLFDRAAIDRMQRHYVALLTAMAAAPDTAIGALPLLSATERATMLTEWNATAAPSGERTDLAIERHAAATPNRPAVQYGDTVLTYRELVTRADTLAARLRRAGVGSESRVGVCLERSERMIVALLAVWKAGAAYVPLDPSFPASRIRFIATDAALHAVVTESDLADRLPPDLAATLVRIDDASHVDVDIERPLPPLERADAALAYILYTSGSTGQPKGVMIEHRSLANLLESFRHEPGFTADDVLLAITTLSFDIAGLELFLPLVSGGRVVVLDRDTAQDGRALADAILAYAPTVLQATPATWRMLIDSGWTGAPSLGIWCGGEALPRTLADELLARGREVWNLYGPTETTIWSTRQQVRAGTGPIPIGRPIANTTAYVLDAQRQPAPPLVAGDLCLGGLGVARGYHDRPALTAERFVVDPFSDSPGDRLYRTGDQARYRPDGLIEYLGRADNQVKIRGFRIELGEIEAVLTQHPDVDEAVVTVREEQAGQPRLAAYLRTVSGRADPGLRDWLRDRLPPYMLPAYLVVLPAFPLTPNGKVDRKALPAPEPGTAADEEHVAPEPGLETLIAGVWRDTLGIARVGATDNFFELGGDSLQAVRLLANVEKLVGHRIPVTVFFQGQTVRAMTRAITEAADDPDALAVVIQRGNRERPIFIVPGIGGEVVGYETLAGTLQTTDAVYGLRSVGLDGETPPLNRIDDIAARFVTEVRRVHPNGPYRLLGLCVGGMVAYEMAQQLQAEGASVELVGLIDTWPASQVAGMKQRFPMMARITDLAARTVRVLTDAWKAPTGSRLAYLRNKAAVAREMAVQGDIFRGDARERGRALVMEANRRAASRYRPKPYNGAGFLIITTGRNLPAYRDPRLAWQRLLRNALPVLRVPGPDSGALLRPPFVAGLASALHQRLESPENGSPPA